MTERNFWGIIIDDDFCHLITHSAVRSIYGKEVRIMVVTKKSIIGEILDYEPETAQFFFAIGMHCLGCPASRGESVEDACAVHSTDADALIAQINSFLAAKQK